MKHKLLTLVLLAAFVATSCNLPVSAPEATATPPFTETVALPSDTPAPTGTPPAHRYAVPYADLHPQRANHHHTR
jgi:hypothetical protein